MSGSRQNRADELRRRAEYALERGQDAAVIEPILTQILNVAEADNPARIFAHRHLAEFRLEQNPWNAALHLRKVLAANPNDHKALSLTGLAQALLGNYRSAISAYRKALARKPNNPWYHHNLGHLLDVGLDAPEKALSHLSFAYDNIGEDEHEITASYAHCLARCGDTDAAAAVARRALEAAPDHPEHRALIEAIRDGSLRPGQTLAQCEEYSAPHVTPKLPDEIHTIWQEGGYCAPDLALAGEYWQAYLRRHPVRPRRWAIYAAALHGYIAWSEGQAIPRKKLAARYGISLATLGNKLNAMKQTIGAGHTAR